MSRTFGRYSLVAKLATGGMAEIFLARMQGVGGFEKQLVIKRILPQYAEDENFVQMFLDEARIAARINHPNICQVYELGEWRDQYYLAMEYLEGVPMTKALTKLTSAGATDIRMMTSVLVQACEGLHAAHELRGPGGKSVGVVHRDVSPHNMFLTVDGALKVLDFGVAKATGASAKTRTGTVKGKYAYMPPEQLRGEAIDRRADVFALGVVLWESLAGRRLFFRDTDFLIFRAITDDPIPRLRDVRPDVPEALDAAVMAALTRDKDARTPTARLLGQAAARALESIGGVMTQLEIAELVERTFAVEVALHRQKVAGAIARSDAESQAVPATAAAPAAAATPALPTAPSIDPVGEEPPIDPAGEPGSGSGREPASALGGAALVMEPSGVAPAAPAPVLTPPPPAAPNATAPAVVPPPKPDNTSGEWFASEPSAAAIEAAENEPSRVSNRRKLTWILGTSTAAIGLAFLLALTIFRNEPSRAATDSAAAAAPPTSSASASPVAVPVAAPTPVTAPAPAAAPTPTPATAAPAPTPVHAAAAAAPAHAPPKPAAPRATTPRPTREVAVVPKFIEPDAPTEPTHASARNAPGTVTIDSSPWATVYLGARRLGTTPLFKVPVPAGKITLRAVLASGEAQTLTVEVEPGRDAPGRRLKW